MTRWAAVVLAGVVLLVGRPAAAQSEEVKKLQGEVEKLRKHLAEMETRLKKAQTSESSPSDFRPGPKFKGQVDPEVMKKHQEEMRRLMMEKFGGGPPNPEKMKEMRAQFEKMMAERFKDGVKGDAQKGDAKKGDMKKGTKGSDKRDGDRRPFARGDEGRRFGPPFARGAGGPPFGPGGPRFGDRRPGGGKPSDLEAKVDRLLKEVEDLRRELRGKGR